MTKPVLLIKKISLKDSESFTIVLLHPAARVSLGATGGLTGGVTGGGVVLEPESFLLQEKITIAKRK